MQAGKKQLVREHCKVNKSIQCIFSHDSIFFFIFFLLQWNVMIIVSIIFIEWNKRKCLSGKMLLKQVLLKK
jgi:hypothetical protein